MGLGSLIAMINLGLGRLWYGSKSFPHRSVYLSFVQHKKVCCLCTTGQLNSDYPNNFGQRPTCSVLIIHSFWIPDTVKHGMIYCIFSTSFVVHMTDTPFGKSRFGTNKVRHLVPTLRVQSHTGKVMVHYMCIQLGALPGLSIF